MNVKGLDITVDRHKSLCLSLYSSEAISSSDLWDIKLVFLQVANISRADILVDHVNVDQQGKIIDIIIVFKENNHIKVSSNLLGKSIRCGKNSLKVSPPRVIDLSSNHSVWFHNIPCKWIQLSTDENISSDHPFFQYIDDKFGQVLQMACRQSPRSDLAKDVCIKFNHESSLQSFLKEFSWNSESAAVISKEKVTLKVVVAISVDDEDYLSNAKVNERYRQSKAAERMKDDLLSDRQRALAYVEKTFSQLDNWLDNETEWKEFNDETLQKKGQEIYDLLLKLQEKSKSLDYILEKDSLTAEDLSTTSAFSKSLDWQCRHISKEMKQFVESVRSCIDSKKTEQMILEDKRRMARLAEVMDNSRVECLRARTVVQTINGLTAGLEVSDREMIESLSKKLVGFVSTVESITSKTTQGSLRFIDVLAKATSLVTDEIARLSPPIQIVEAISLFHLIVAKVDEASTSLRDELDDLSHEVSTVSRGLATSCRSLLREFIKIISSEGSTMNDEILVTLEGRLRVQARLMDAVLRVAASVQSRSRACRDMKAEVDKTRDYALDLKGNFSKIFLEKFSNRSKTWEEDSKLEAEGLIDRLRNISFNDDASINSLEVIISHINSFTSLHPLKMTKIIADIRIDFENLKVDQEAEDKRLQHEQESRKFRRLESSVAPNRLPEHWEVKEDFEVSLYRPYGEATGGEVEPVSRSSTMKSSLSSTSTMQRRGMRRNQDTLPSEEQDLCKVSLDLKEREHNIRASLKRRKLNK